MNVFELAAKLTLDKTEYESGLKDAEHSAEKAGSTFSGKLAKGAKIAAAGFAVLATGTVATVGYLKQATSQAAEAGDRIDKMSQKMGMSAEAFQEWDFIMQHCGTSIESMQAGMKTLATAAENGNDAFARLGITQEQIASMSQEELFGAVIEGLQGVTDTTERTYLASQLLGRGATELGALLNMTAEETEAMKQQLHDMGGVMSDEAVKAAAKYQDALQNMQKALTSLKINFASKFLPGLTEVMDGITLLVSGQDGGVEKFTEGIEQIGEVITKALPKAAEGVAKLASSFISMIGQNIPTIMRSLIDVAKTLLSTLSAALPDLIPQVIQGIVDAILMLTDPDNMEDLIEGMVNFVTAMSIGIAKAAPIIAEAMPVIITNLVAAIIKAAPQIAEAGVQLFSALGTGMRQIIFNVVAVVPRIIASIAKAFRDGVKDMIQAGINLISGIGKGIRQGLKNVLIDAKNAGASILNVFKSIFRIASPSKVMEGFGKFLDVGLANGITQNAGLAARAMENLSGMVSGSITATVGASASGGVEYTMPGRYSDMGTGRDLTIILEMDKQQFAKTVYKMNNEERQRVGVQLSGAY
jgi:hypothetical protein